ncbi:uncharacterized protein K444DRAFT_662619 [Hyaloscypha bicolor E]|uniref:Uncharacterized protein n=1 Tax=Hyaloscypha bicolor E TaxID=1095630 RepID=A0A2J6TEW8_9HELO|nr:uncharacterized protein K444DRAFT_662619 [Hyaloscypha bicolor E]PMD61581.1 hypothetical protein K444DRAFT_662619 [Hyaloscypha bicolor E]
MTARSFSLLLLATLAHGQLVPTAFSSNTGACDSPFVTDCLALRARLQGSDNSTFQILHDTWTPINSYADCALSVLWPQNVGEGWLSPTYSIAADALDVMMDFGLDDNTISGVLARTDMDSDQQPIYWALTGAYTDNDSWQASFEECLSGAQSSFTEAPGAVVDTSITPDPASLDEFEAALNQNQRRSGSVKSTRDKKEALARRAITTQPTCNQVYVNFGTDNHYRCICNNRQYDLFCDYRSSASEPNWTENLRQAAILDLSTSVSSMWTSNTIQPGASYSSNPLGAVLYTGTSGSTDRVHVPDPDGNECCSYLLYAYCASSHGPTGRSDFVSGYGMCQPSYTHEYTYSVNEAFNEYPGGGPGPSNPKSSPRVGRLPGEL